MKRRRNLFHALFAVLVVLFFHITADGFAFFHVGPSRTTAHFAATSTHSLTHNQTEILSSYLSNLQKSRRHVLQDTYNNDNKQQLLKPAKSLAFFLSTTYQMSSHEDPLFDRAVVQAIRLASSLNDYRFILQLTEQLIDRAQDANASLHPRMLGEAVRGLSATSASAGKIKTLWNQSKRNCWQPSVGALEVNAMLEAMCQKGKTKVAMELYREAFRGNQSDSFSLSILFKGLAASIQDASAVETTNVNVSTSVTTPLLSVCWQWNEALVLFESLLVLHNNSDSQLLSNPTIATLLEINFRADQVFGHDHDGAAKAILLFDVLQRRRFPLDAITCTVILSQLQTEWKTALSLLGMINEKNSHANGGSTEWALPEPNARVYSAVMAVCARAGRYQETWELLEEMKANPKLDCGVNTWIYNSVLQATAKAASQSKPKQRKELLMEMLEVFDQMDTRRQEDPDVAPDTVTYNTMLSGISTCASAMNFEDWQNIAAVELCFNRVGCSGASDLIFQLLEKMERDEVNRDERTYVHSLQAMAKSSFRLDDIKSILKLSINDLSHNHRIYNAAMTATLFLGEFRIEATQKILSEMLEAGFSIDFDTVTVLIDALCAGRKTKSVALLFEALRGDEDAQSALAEHTCLSICSCRSKSPEITLYTHAISQCLVAGDFEAAHTILDQVKRHELTLSDEHLDKVAQSYALSALSIVQHKPKNRARRKIVFQSARSRAENAFSILSSIDKASLKSLALLSNACARSGLPDKAQSSLRQVHTQFLDSQSRYSPRLHASLMQQCAISGNISLALRLCEDIQYLAAQLAWMDSPQKSPDFPKTVSNFTESTLLLQEMIPVSLNSLGMNLVEWKWLIQAAAKDGDWKVCLSTLHMLRPYVENILEEDQHSGAVHSKDYKILCSALGITISCLCANQKPAWVIRSIDDWILWSGRKPPHEAVTKAVRLLSSKGQHDVVASLLSKSISAGVGEDPSYEIKLVVVAISTLYKDGHYVAADDIFLLAVTNGWIPFDLKRQDIDDGTLVLDLHGMNLPVAHSAVRVAFQQGLLSNNWSDDDKQVTDMVIVTGKGRNSALQMRPVLRPAVQRMLVEEFYPPIGTVSVPGNMGALRVSAEDIRSWLQFQRQQKGARMIEVATALKKTLVGLGFEDRSPFCESNWPEQFVDLM